MSIPVSSVHHIEDVGHLLLEAQKDLARVRQRLDAIPLESSHSAAAGGGANDGVAADTLASLRDILNKTESGLRVKAEAVLKSVEENRINTLPQGHDHIRYAGDFHLAQVVVEPEYGAAHARYAATPQTMTSPTRARTVASQQQAAYLRRPVADRMAESRAMELLSRPTDSALARDFISSKFGLSPPAPVHGAPSTFVGSGSAPSPTAAAARGPPRRPVDRYGPSSSNPGQIARGGGSSASSVSASQVLPLAYRRTPGLFPPISGADAAQGVLSLVTRGMVPAYIDLSAPFAASPSPLQASPVPFHPHAAQFERRQVRQHHFDLSAVQLDLGESILNPSEEEKEQDRVLLERAQQATSPAKGQARIAATGGRALEASSFAFPLLMPGSDGEEQNRTASNQPWDLPDDQDVDDLLFPTQSEGGDDDEGERLGGAGEQQMVPYASPEAPEEARDYDSLLDTYSLHQLLLRKGKIPSSTPEFHSFHRTYASLWGGVSVVLRAVEGMVRGLGGGLPLVTVFGQRVAALAQRAEDNPASTRLSEEQLWECIDTAALMSGGSGPSPLVKSLLRLPARARKFAVGGEVARTMAALLIQATWRMFLQRRLYLVYRRRHSRAIAIQRVFRRWARRCATRLLVQTRWEGRLEAWRRDVQEPFKKSWSHTASEARSRVHIHVPSLSSSPSARGRVFHLGVRENTSLLARVAHVRDEGVEVVYVSPFALPSDTLGYTMKLLAVGGVASPEGRVKIVLPENMERFNSIVSAPDPSGGSGGGAAGGGRTMSLSSLLLYSPKALRRVRELVRGRPAVIFPGTVGPEDLALAVELGLPLMSAEPDGVAVFGSKSGSKRVFASAEVPVPPGAHDIYSEGDLLAFLARLVVAHLGVHRWVVKHDAGEGGSGTAWIDVSSLGVVQALREEKRAHEARWSLPEVVSNARERVSVALKKSMARRMVLAAPESWGGSWALFAAALYDGGGVIEAAPPVVIGSPSVNMFIDPDGSVRILNSHDQVFASAFRFAGANFPSQAPSDLIHPPALSIGRQCAREGVIGDVGVDFVAWHEGPGGSPKLWAVDLNLRMTATQNSFAVFDFLLKGRYVFGSTPAAKEQPIHLRPPARYLVSATGGLQAAPAASVARSASKTGLASHTASPSARMFGSTGSGASSASSSRDNSRPTSSQSVTKLPGIGKKDASAKEECRFYSSVPYLYQPHLATVQFASFFSLCRMRGVSFDVRARVGTVFCLMDSLASGSLGMLCVGLAAPPTATASSASFTALSSLAPSPLHAMSLLVDALSFLHEQVSSLRLGPHMYDSESNLLPMLAAMKGLVRAQKEAQHALRSETNEAGRVMDIHAH